MNRLRLVHKVFLALFGVSLLVVLAASGLSRWGFEQTFASYLEAREQARLEALAEDLAPVWAEQQSWAPLLQDRRLFAQLVLGAAGRPPREGRPPRRLPRTALQDADGSLLLGRAVSDDGPRVPVQVAGATVGWVLAAPRRGVRNELEEAFRARQLVWLAVAAGVALLVAAALAFPLARSLVRPVQAVAGAARALAAGDEQSRVPVTRHDELGQLAADFNHLAAAMTRAAQARRDWMADISHELRTPLAVAQAELQALLDGVRPLDAAALGSLREELDRLQGLVDDLWQLARSDLGAMDYRMQPLDLGELAADAVAAWQERAAAADLALSWQSAGGRVLGDAARLRQLLDNLLANSLAYTDSGGEVRVEVAAAADGVALRVADSAPGVAEDALPRLFERLYRAESSRNRAQGGAGLGLALVQAIAEGHGGQVSAAPSSLGGLEVTVHFPEAP